MLQHQQNTITSLVYVTVPDTQVELESFFTSNEVTRANFWTLTNPTLDLFNFIIFETMFEDSSSFIGKYLYSMNLGVMGEVISVETINSNLVAKIKYSTVEFFKKKEILSIINPETQEILEPYVAYVLDTKDKKPVQKQLLPSLKLLQKSLMNKKYKTFTFSFNPEKPHRRDPADLLITELDYRTNQRKEWYFQVDKLPITDTNIQDINEDSIIFYTNEGTYGISKEIPGLEIKSKVL